MYFNTSFNDYRGILMYEIMLIKIILIYILYSIHEMQFIYLTQWFYLYFAD